MKNKIICYKLEEQQQVHNLRRHQNVAQNTVLTCKDATNYESVNYVINYESVNYIIGTLQCYMYQTVRGNEL